MDELIIDDKKYISSKQAAKLTGYAKDYVGQLCREGRVQARLVGRAWYVLESSIQDHRFGPAIEKGPSEASRDRTVKSGSIFSPAWQPPRYEPTVSTMLPQIEDKETLEETAKDAQEQVQDSPENWPDMPMETTPTEEMEEEVVVEEAIQTEDLVTMAVEEPVPVEPAAPLTERPRRRRKVRYLLVRATKTIGIVIALGFATMALINSGYTDDYLYSFKQAHVFSGISVYNK